MLDTAGLFAFEEQLGLQLLDSKDTGAYQEMRLRYGTHRSLSGDS